jgi:antitoxin component YwqK of YwqJK toxin-antitoxin module
MLLTMKKAVFIILFLWSFSITFSQNNQFDANGKRHGVWLKRFKNGNIRYQGKFNHGKEVGTFKYFSLESKVNPIIIKKFNPNDDIASVRFFTPTGKLLSRGKMQGKTRIDKWVYYHKDGKSILQEENYVNGKLDGKYTTYFINKKPTIEANYKNGLLDGSYKRYSIKGHIYQDLHYKNGTLNGAVAYYNRLTGDLIKKGFYKNDKKTGVWEFYFEGELIETNDFTKNNSKK